MYDYDLAKAVARNSQMHPKVYLPMLKRLRSLPEFVARFEVDIKLERYESALDRLYKSGIETDQMIVMSINYVIVTILRNTYYSDIHAS